VAEPRGNPPGPPHAARNATHYACRQRLTPLAGDKIDAPTACAVPFRPYCGGVITQMRNVSEYMLVLALCLVYIFYLDVLKFFAFNHITIQIWRGVILSVFRQAIVHYSIRP